MAKSKLHKDYEDYKKMILNSQAYDGLRQSDAKFGKFNWLGPLTTPKGKARRAWWNQQCKKLGIDISRKGCYAKAAYAIHPTKKHVCQCCGKELWLSYVYPKLPIVKKLNLILGTSFNQTDYTIHEIVNQFCTNQFLLDSVSALFNGDKGFNQIELIRHIEKTGDRYLSPGAMSDSPDRFDGFHSYGLCCRKKEDKGRHDANMKLYGQDRRAYEDWADGDWQLANKLMSSFRNAPKMVCPKCKSRTKKSMTADHIGPISLGFCHMPYFAPMCSSCNSSKNNRLYKTDVDKLLKLEAQGVTVISWHSKYVWDKLKNSITNDEEAFRLSKVMSACHKNVLYLFYLIYSATGAQFLMRYLHPEYAMFNHQISKLDLSNLNNLKIVSKTANSLNKQSLKRRYIRVAFESLKEIGQKKNRRIKYFVNDKTPQVKKIIDLVNQGQNDIADKEINNLIISIVESINSIIK